MTPRRQRRLYMVGFIVVGAAITLVLVLNAFQSNLLYFVTPSEVEAGEVPLHKPFRIGGLVVEGSINRPGDDLLVVFDLTDSAHSVRVHYSGILPDLFRDGQGVVVKGRLNPHGVFVASEVLAKHDENYMPPEVAEALEAASTLVTE